jgi:hypothetical protein
MAAYLQYSGENIKPYPSEPIAKLVTPVKTGVQRACNASKFLDSGFRRNDLRGIYATSAIASSGLFHCNIVINAIVMTITLLNSGDRYN